MRTSTQQDYKECIKGGCSQELAVAWTHGRTGVAEEHERHLGVDV
jgi:hypothetical protein